MHDFGRYIKSRLAGDLQGDSSAREPAEPAASQESADAIAPGASSAGDTYERARDEIDIVPANARHLWQQADRMERTLHAEVERILDEPDITAEAKARRASQLFEEKSNVIAQKKRETREALLKASAAAYRASFPIFSGQALQPADTAALLADQNEAERIVRTAKVKEEKSGPFGYSATNYLREQYARGLEIQGVEGASLIRGTLRAAEELGIDQESVVAAVRQERHLEYADKARRLEHFSDMLSTTPPRMSRRTGDRLQRLARGSTSSTASAIGAQRSSHAFVGGDRQPVAKTEGSHSQGQRKVPSKRKKFK